MRPRPPGDNPPRRFRAAACPTRASPEDLRPSCEIRAPDGPPHRAPPSELPWPAPCPPPGQRQSEFSDADCGQRIPLPGEQTLSQEWIFDAASASADRSITTSPPCTCDFTPIGLQPPDSPIEGI